MRNLVINGGGSAGYAAACFLSHLQDEMKQPWDTLFEMVCGVSTGSLIASAIVHKNMRAEEIARRYVECLPRIFRYRWRWKWLSELIAVFHGTVYDPKNLQKELKGLFGDQCWDSVTQRLMCMALATGISPKQKPRHWKSWVHDPHNCTKIVDVLAASCSAMYYFPPHEIAKEWFVDGGIVCNNPTVHAWVEAKYNLRANDPVSVMNIQCLDWNCGVRNPSKLSSLLSWKNDLASVFTVSGEASSVYLANKLVNGSAFDSTEEKMKPERYMEVPLNITTAMDSVTKRDFSMMASRAFIVWEVLKPAVVRFFEGVPRGTDASDSEGYRPHPVTT
jgi:predicted acylesterase/phospholipase RssA